MFPQSALSSHAHRLSYHPRYHTMISDFVFQRDTYTAYAPVFSSRNVGRNWAQFRISGFSHALNLSFPRTGVGTRLPFISRNSNLNPMMLAEVRSGCFIVTWCIPESIVEKIEDKCTKLKTVLKNFAVTELKVAGRCVHRVRKNRVSWSNVLKGRAIDNYCCLFLYSNRH